MKYRRWGVGLSNGGEIKGSKVGALVVRVQSDWMGRQVRGGMERLFLKGGKKAWGGAWHEKECEIRTIKDYWVYIG